MRPFVFSFVVAVTILSLLWKTVLAQSLRGAAEHEELPQQPQQELQQELQQQQQRQGDRRDLLTANVIRTFYLTITASQPANPSSIVSSVATTMQTQTTAWMQTNKSSEKIVSSTAPSTYVVGTSWPGSRRLGTCNYLCIINQIKSCRLCRRRRLQQATAVTTSTNTTTERQLGTTVVTELTDLEKVLKPLLSLLFKNITKLNVTVTEQTL